jgi:hypothetical protein
MFYFTGLHAGEVDVGCNHMLIVRANVQGMGRRCVVVQLGWSFHYVMFCVLVASLHPPRYTCSLGQGPNLLASLIYEVKDKCVRLHSP